MTGTGSSHDFAYVHSDIPEGMTIRAWRAQRAAEHIARRTAERAERRRRRAGRMQQWLTALQMPLPRPRLHRQEAEG
jgi:hypothetical protein